MRITIHLFAKLRDLAGAGEFRLELAEGATVETAWQSVTRECPALLPYRPSVAAAVNADYARFTAAVADGDEVAFLPPVSGG